MRTDAGTSAPSAACFEPERSVLTVSRLRPRPSRLGNCPGRRGRRDLSVMAFGLIKERKVRKKSFFSFVLFFSRAYKHWGISVRFCTFCVYLSFLVSFSFSVFLSLEMWNQDLQDLIIGSFLLIIFIINVILSRCCNSLKYALKMLTNAHRILQTSAPAAPLIHCSRCISDGERFRSPCLLNFATTRLILLITLDPSSAGVMGDPPRLLLNA